MCLHYLGVLSMNWLDNIVFNDIFNFNILNFLSCSFNSWSSSGFNKVSEFLVMFILKVKVDIVIPTRDPRTPQSKSAQNDRLGLVRESLVINSLTILYGKKDGKYFWNFFLKVWKLFGKNNLVFWKLLFDNHKMLLRQYNQNGFHQFPACNWAQFHLLGKNMALLLLPKYFLVLVRGQLKAVNW